MNTVDRKTSLVRWLRSGIPTWAVQFAIGVSTFVLLTQGVASHFRTRKIESKFQENLQQLLLKGQGGDISQALALLQSAIPNSSFCLKEGDRVVSGGPECNPADGLKFPIQVRNGDWVLGAKVVAQISVWEMGVTFFFGLLAFSGTLALLVLRGARRLEHDLSSLKDPELSAIYFEELIEIRERLQKLDGVHAESLQNQLQNSLSRMAAQVVHDIRSPLTALDMVSKDVHGLSDEKRLMVKSAATRIRDITNQLLEKNPAAPNLSTAPQFRLGLENSETYMLAYLAESMVSEKRIQLRSRSAIGIESRLSGEAYGLFVKIKAADFKRALSDLIEVRIQALEGTGNLTLSLSKDPGDAKKARLSIVDDGPTSLSSAGVAQVHRAQEWLSALGGKLLTPDGVELKSKLIVQFPLTQSPEWFLPTLRFAPKTTVVVVDDDTSIHQIWEGRFQSQKSAQFGVVVVHLSTPDELLDWVKQRESLEKTLFLVDFEFLGQNSTGLDVIERAGIQGQSVLVTSRFEEKPVQEQCVRLGIKLIPKGMAVYIPIQIQQILDKPDAVLIDEDIATHLEWKEAAKNLGKDLRIFFSPDYFFTVADSLDRSTPIYFDKKVGGKVFPEEVAKKLTQAGFSQVHLLSGESTNSEKKRPPFIA